MEDYGLKDPERPLGTIKWPEFTSSVDEQDKSVLTRTYTALYHLNRRHEAKHEAHKRQQEWDPLGLETSNPARKPEPTELPFLTNAEWDNPTGELEIDLDNLYILARTGELDRARGLGEKTLNLVTDLVNEQIDAAAQKTSV